MATTIEEMFESHWGLVCGYLTRRTADPSLAEELAQETFYRATRAFLGWRGGQPSAWLLAIARNVLIDETRKGRRLVPLEDSLAGETGLEEESVQVRAALAQLPATPRRLLELSYLEGFSLAEIAVMSGTSVGAIKTALWRARAAFRARFAEVSDEPPTVRE